MWKICLPYIRELIYLYIEPLLFDTKISKMSFLESLCHQVFLIKF